MAQFTIPDMLPSTQYAIQLRASGGELVSEWSQKFLVTTTGDLTPPDVPTALTNIVDGDTFVQTFVGVNQALTQNLDLNHYELSLTDGITTVIVPLAAGTVKYTLTFDQNRIFFGTSKAAITAKVRSVDNVGNASAYTSTALATNPAPGPVTSLVATPQMEGILLTWVAPSDIDLKGYRVDVSTTGSGGTYTTVYSGSNNTLTYPTTMFATDHWFKVYAVDKFGTLSSVVTTVSAVRPKSAFTVDLVAPAAPTTVVATNGFDTTNQQAYVDLTWTPAADTDLAFNIVRYGLSTGQWDYIQVDKAITAVRINVNAGTPYYFAVASKDFSGNNSAYTNASVYPKTTSADTSIPPTPATPSASANTLQVQVTLTGLDSVGGAMPKDIAYYEVYASPTTGFTPATANMVGTIVQGPVLSNTFDIPAGAGSGSTQTWYIKVIAVDKTNNKSAAASAQTSAAIGLIGVLNIADAIITDAKITTLAANKITAGTGLIADLTVKSVLTLGDASSTGVIKSYDYVTSSGAAGFYLSKTGLIIKSGAIEAAALKIQWGENIMPPAFADFEAQLSFYDLMPATYALKDVRAGTSVYNSQYLNNVYAAGGAGVKSELYFGTSATDYNIPVEAGKTYIVSGYFMKNSGTVQGVQFGIKDDTATKTLITLNASTVTTTSTYTRLYGTWTAPGGVAKAMLYLSTDASVAADFRIDALQVEPQWGALATPSTWSAPGSTVIDGGMIRTGEIRSNTTTTLNSITMPTWSINSGGAAEFSNLLIRGNSIVGSDLAEADLSYIKSYNYIAGQQGWIIQTDGYAEFRQMDSNSIHADSLQVGTFTADMLADGTISAELVLASNMTVLDHTLSVVTNKALTTNIVTLTTASAHGRVTGDRVDVDISDAIFDSVAGVYDIITSVPSTVSFTYVRVHADVTSAAVTDGRADFYGRSVITSPQGINMYAPDGTTAIVSIPTNPQQQALFTGSGNFVGGLIVNDYLNVSGVNNSMGIGSILTLNSSATTPASAPTPSLTYDSVDTWIDGSYSSGRFGLAYDTTKFVTANVFYGGGAFSYNSTGAYIGNDPMANTYLDANPWGGVTYLSGYYYVLVYSSGDRAWYVHKYDTTGTGFSTRITRWVYDRSTVGDFFVNGYDWRGTVDGGKLKIPAIGNDGTNILIGRCDLAGKIRVSTFSPAGVWASTVTTNVTDNQNIVSVSGGSFDFGAARFVVTTAGAGGVRTSKNYVFNTSGVQQSLETFPAPNNINLCGTVWTGSKFVSLGTNNSHYSYTSLGNQVATSWAAKSTWYNATTPAFTVTNKAITTNVGKLTTSATHSYIVGDFVTVTGVDATFNGTWKVSAVTGTTLFFPLTAADVVATSASGTITRAVYETTQSTPNTFNIIRRAKLSLGTATIPGAGGARDPAGVRFYVSNAGTAGTFYSQGNVLGSSIQTFATTPVFSGTTTTETRNVAGVPTLMIFPDSTPSKLVSSNGLLELNSAGYALFGSKTDASLASGNTPALRLGDPSAAHMRIDNNEIIAMASDTTTATLYLQGSGSTSPVLVNKYTSHAKSDTITPSAANTVTTKTISFDVTFNVAPKVFIQETNSYNSSNSMRMWVDSVTTSNFVVGIIKGNTVASTFDWFAFDPRSA